MGSPMIPVTAKPVVMTPATTVSGVAALITKKTTAGTPSLLCANVRDTLSAPSRLAWDMRTP